jgi:competence protein ComEA
MFVVHNEVSGNSLRLAREFFSVLLLALVLLTVACSKPAPVADSNTPLRSAIANHNTDNELVDLNSASKTQLISLPGIGEVQAQKIIAGRPYREKTELTRKGIIADKTYALISERVIARRH